MLPTFTAVIFTAAASARVACVPAPSAGLIMVALREPALSGEGPASGASMEAVSEEASTVGEEASMVGAEAGDKSREEINP